jgi:hypothetical protein
MKRLFVLPVIALALLGLLVYTACSSDSGSDPNPSQGVDTSAIKATIKEAYDTSYGVKEATIATEVAEGLKWVTKAEMNALNVAIRSAETARDNRSSQSSVNAANSTLRTAITAFNTAKKDGTGNSITLSGTITVKNNGQTVPYIEIKAHDGDWIWQEITRFPSSASTNNWSITMKPLSTETRVTFRVTGYADNTYNPPLFSIEVDDPWVMVSNQSKSNIAINLDLKLITLSGTISGSYDGKPVPYVIMHVYKKDNSFFLGETVDILNVGSNRQWSIVIESLDEETEIMFSVWGHTDRWWGGDELFSLWGRDFGISEAQRTIKDQDKSDININFGNIKNITLSGTINVTHNGQPLPYLRIEALTIDENENWNWFGSTDFPPTGNSTLWSITMEAFAQNTEILFLVYGFNNRSDMWTTHLFRWQSDVAEPPVTITVKDQNIPNIVLDLGNIETRTLSGTINVTYDRQPVPYVGIVAWAYNDDDYYYLGDTHVTPVGNTAWSIITTEVFDNDMSVLFEIWGYSNTNPSGDDNRLFYHDVNTDITFKDQDVTNIVFNLGNIDPEE